MRLILLMVVSFLSFSANINAAPAKSATPAASAESDSKIVEDVTDAAKLRQYQQLKNVAKKRLYYGGQDEESLKVQPQLVVPTRKMGPSEAEATEAE